MGKITDYNPNKFIKADYIYSKVKRDFKSFNAVNLIDDSSFPEYTMDILRQIGNSGMREQDALIILHGNNVKLPEDFYMLHAAYRCKNANSSNKDNRIFQNKNVFEHDITCEILQRSNNCQIDCCADDKIIQRVTIKNYVNDTTYNYEYNCLGLLTLSPNVNSEFAKHGYSRGNEITINDGYLFTNCEDDAIYMLYYAFPYDETGIPMIPEDIYVEKAIENYIKWQLLLNFWIVDDVANVGQKAQFYKQEYERAMAEVRYNKKLPPFSTLVNYLRDKRSINPVTFFANQTY